MIDVASDLQAFVSQSSGMVFNDEEISSSNNNEEETTKICNVNSVEEDYIIDKDVATQINSDFLHPIDARKVVTGSIFEVG